ncbi:MAG: rubrerythrin family protein [Elusimicrobiota bacterium]|jgi:rubrerythrin|nr:rubrerythrin family protein [Elusimicrobiota bacterium]
MADLKGSKTEANLKAAFAGESQARNKYTYFAAKAKEEGFESAAAFFKEAAKNEREHAKIWFKLLGGLKDTAGNLAAAIEGEAYENSTMYPEFAKVAKAEGFNEIAKLLESVGEIEKEHEAKFKKLLECVKSGSAKETKSSELPTWKCRSCGYTVKAKEAPTVCCVCGLQDIAWSGSKAFIKVQE